jgi:hypothetical protein
MTPRSWSVHGSSSYRGSHQRLQSLRGQTRSLKQPRRRRSTLRCKYATLVNFFSVSHSTTFRITSTSPGASAAQAAKRVVYVTLSEPSDDTYGLGSRTDDDETFTFSFALHSKRIPKPPVVVALDAAGLGVGILGQGWPSHQVARVVMRSHETVGDLLLRLGAVQVGLFAPDA